jgi:hypothetical protein
MKEMLFNVLTIPKLGVVAQACKPNYLRGRTWKISSPMTTWHQSKTLSQSKAKTK